MSQSEQQPQTPSERPRYGDYRDHLPRHPAFPLTTTGKTAGAIVISTPGIVRRKP